MQRQKSKAAKQLSMDSPRGTDFKQNNTSSTSDDNLGIFKAKVEHEISVLQNSQAVQSRSQNVMRDEDEEKTKLLQSRLTGLQKVTAKHIDDSTAQKNQTEADLKTMKMKIKSMQGVVTELTRICSQSERQRIDRAWVTPPGAGCRYEQASAPIRRSNSLDSIRSVPDSYPTQCQPFNNFEQRKKQMLATHGIVRTQQKKKMLQIWRARRGSNDNLMQALLLKMSRFLNKNVNSLDLSVGELFDIVIDQIPDYDWLKFVRTELGLKESEIRKVKQTCEPTDEQLHQLFLEGGAED